MSDKLKDYVNEPLAVIRPMDDDSWRVDRFTKPPKPPTVPAQLAPVARFALFMVVSLALGWYALLWGFYIQPRVYQPPIEIGPDLSVLLSYPKYIAVGDEGQIDLTAINTSDRPLTATVALVFTGDPAAQALPDSANSASLKELASGGGQTTRLRFQVHQAPRPFHSGVLTFVLRADVAGQVTDSQPFSIALAPFPYLRRLMSGSLGLAALLGLFWGRAKKWLLPE